MHMHMHAIHTDQVVKRTMYTSKHANSKKETLQFQKKKFYTNKKKQSTTPVPKPVIEIMAFPVLLSLVVRSRIPAADLGRDLFPDIQLALGTWPLDLVVCEVHATARPSACTQIGGFGVHCLSNLACGTIDLTARIMCSYKYIHAHTHQAYDFCVILCVEKHINRGWMRDLFYFMAFYHVAWLSCGCGEHCTARGELDAVFF